MAKEAALRDLPRKPLALALASAFITLAGQPSHGQTGPSTLPAGGTVTAGSATLTYSPNKLQIDQSTNKAILQWDSFSIGSSAWVNFSQPSSSAIALNRVTGNNPSEIFGRLTANGQVFLSNPNGVLFAPSASVDVGALFATTLSIADQDFLAGRYNFYNAGGAGSVINQGNIVTANGYAALAGPQVRNDGIIVAHAGTVALAAGDRVSLDMVGDGLISVTVDQAALSASAVNAGTIQADGGRVILTARSANALLDTVVNNSGVIRANSLVERNGEILLAADGAVALGGSVNGGTISADVGGKLAVTGFVSSVGGQAINARALSVNGQLINTGGDQTVRITGDGLNGGIDVQFGSISNNGGGNQSFELTNADHFNVNGGSVFAFGGAQDISLTGDGRNAIALGGPGAFGQSFVGGAANQTVTAGAPGEQGSITIVGTAFQNTLAGFVTSQTPGGTQTISTSGPIAITGGTAPSQASNFATGIFHNGGGAQTISASAVTLAGGPSGNNNPASIRSGIPNNPSLQGDQLIHVANGVIELHGSDAGTNNRAVINSAANQTIDGDPVIRVVGGAGGGADLAGNNAAISTAAGRMQTIRAADIEVRSGAAGTDNSAAIQGGVQDIRATGDVVIAGGGSGGTRNSAIIGGPSSPTLQPTNLVLDVGRDLIMTGGSMPNASASIGSSIFGTGTPRNDIAITVGRDVILTSGSATGARIGTSTLVAPTDGHISIAAGRDIQLNGGAQPTVVRTLGDVTLSAGNAITEGVNGYVVANRLTTSSGAATALTGTNQVALLDASSGYGVVDLHNTGPLTVEYLFAPVGTASITNAGSVAVNGPWTSSGASLTTTGTAADVAINNSLFSSGPLDLDVSGKVDVNGLVSSAGGQTINAHALGVTYGQLTNNGGDQTVRISGDGLNGGVDVQFGSIFNNGGGNQSFLLTDADHFDVNGGAVLDFGGTQNISLTGVGRNAIALGGPGVFGSSYVGGAVQAVTAGAPGEQGSITIVGTPLPNTLAAFVSGQTIGGTQTISTSGELNITGGTAALQNPFGFATGLFHNGTGLQTVNAASIEIRGGPSGNNNTGLILSSGGAGRLPAGDQVINITGGDIRMAGGLVGANNRALIRSTAAQTITGSPDLILGGGAVISADKSQTIDAGMIQITGGATGTGNNAAIVGSADAAQLQLIHAASISLAAGSGGTDNSAAIIGSRQELYSAGDVLLTGGGSLGANNAARIGATVLGGSLPLPTDLRLQAGGDVILTAGTTGAAVLGSGVGQPPAASSNVISVQAGRDVILNASDTVGVRIGGSVLAPVGSGDIAVQAGRNIALNGTAQPATLRTSGNVALTAGSAISESGNAYVMAGDLTVASGGPATLTGQNQIASFSATSSGDVALNNASPLLTVASVQTNGGSFKLMQAGDASFVGNADVGALDVQTTSAVSVLGGNVDGVGTEVAAHGPIDMLTGSDLRIVGGSGSGAFAMLKGYSDINLTVGGELRINAGTGEGAFARLQTATRDSSINIFFPNLASGGFYVNDVEGALRRGLTGILSGEGVAVPGQTLFVTYGE